MKKMLAMLLALALAVTCVACNRQLPTEDPMQGETTSSENSCDGTEPEASDGNDTPADTTACPTTYEPPPVDPTPAVDAELPMPYEPIAAFSAQNADGIRMEVTVLGRMCDGAGYLQSSAPLMMEVILTNKGESLISQRLTTYCRNGTPAHNHELQMNITDGNGHALYHDRGFACGQLLDAWTLAPGESEAFMLTLMPFQFDIADESLYTDSFCFFFGEISFPYYIGEADIHHLNEKTLSVGVSFSVKYTGAQPESESFVGDYASTSWWQRVSKDKTIVMQGEMPIYRYTNSYKDHVHAEEPLVVTVTVENKGDYPIYQTIPACKDIHDHELEVLGVAYDGAGYEIRHREGSPCVSMDKTWCLAPGERKTWELTLYPVNFDPHDTSLYDEDGLLKFSCEVSFTYFRADETGAASERETLSSDFVFYLCESGREHKLWHAFDSFGKGEDTSPSETTPPETTTAETTLPISFTEKPVIYLYPEKETEVTVKLDYKGTLLCTYPAYEGGWHVLARPDGSLVSFADGKEYSYLFWDGLDDVEYDMSRGYCVKGEDTAAFLQEILEKMGLTPRESNEFIVYWLPRMQQNPYNLITFQGEAYTDTAPLLITPTPDSMLRVFMVWKPLTAYVEVEAPDISTFERKGFAVVEWGGKEVR